MSANVFSDQQVMAGQRIGICTAYAILIYIIIACLIPFNTYHLSNMLTNLLGDSWIATLSYPLSAALTAAEMPIVQSLVTNYRLDPDSKIVKMQSAVLGLLILLTVMGGNTSQFISADKKDASIQSHQTQEQSIDARKKTLESDWRIATRTANKIKDSTDREIAISQANYSYYANMAGVNNELSKHQQTRPTTGIKTGSFMHVFLVNLLSLSLVIVSMFLSGFLAVYHTTLVASPAFSFMSKKAHKWLSSASNFVTSQHEISPINDTASGYVKVDKRPTSDSQPNDTGNRPQPSNTTLLEDSSVSVRTLDEQPEGGQTFRDFVDSDYDELKEGIVTSEIQPTVRPVKDWLLEKRLCLTDTKRQQVATQCLKRLHDDGVLILNPEQGKTNRVVAKYVLPSSVKSEQGDSETIAGDEIGPFDITTYCGDCGTYSYTRIDELLDTQKGIVCCEGCSKNYVAQSHLAKDSQPITEALKAEAIAAKKAA